MESRQAALERDCQAALRAGASGGMRWCALPGSRERKIWSLEKKAVAVMCADNGIIEEGVSQSGHEVTTVVTGNIARGLPASTGWPPAPGRMFTLWMWE